MSKRNRDNIVGVGIIGVGYWGPNLVRNFMQIEESDVRWVCDLSKDRLDFICGEWPDLNVTGDYRSVLEDEGVQAVVIATPFETHAGIAAEAMDTGKHVFIEKPMAANSAETTSLLEKAREKNLQIGTGHIFVYHPAVVAMRDILAQGEIGRFFYAHSTRMNPAPSHGNVDVVWDLAVHDVSISLYLKGAVPSRVRASGGSFAHGERTDAASLELLFADGAIAFHHVGWLTSARERSFFVACRQGSMKFDETAEEKLRIVGPAVDSRLDKNAQKGHISYAAGETQVLKLAATEPLKNECGDFLRAVINRTSMVSDGAFGDWVVKVLEGATLSLQRKGAYIDIGC